MFLRLQFSNIFVIWQIIIYVLQQFFYDLQYICIFYNKTLQTYNLQTIEWGMKNKKWVMRSYLLIIFLLFCFLFLEKKSNLLWFCRKNYRYCYFRHEWWYLIFSMLQSYDYILTTCVNHIFCFFLFRYSSRCAFLVDLDAALSRLFSLGLMGAGYSG